MKKAPIEILLVEDNDDDVVLIQEAFSRAKSVHVVDGVSDGEEALKYLRRQGHYVDADMPTLVFLDINMPKKNGFEVLHEIKRDRSLWHLPVIMLTTSKREEDVVRSYANGACSYLIKPVDFRHFQEVVEAFERYWTQVSAVPVHPH